MTQHLPPYQNQAHHRQSLQQSRSVAGNHSSHQEPHPSPQGGRNSSLSSHAPSPAPSHHFNNLRAPYAPQNQGSIGRQSSDPVAYYQGPPPSYASTPSSTTYGTDFMATAQTMRPPGHTMYNHALAPAPATMASPHEPSRHLYAPYMGYYQQPSSNYIYQSGQMQHAHGGPRSQYSMNYSPVPNLAQTSTPVQAPSVNNTPPRPQMMPTPDRFSQIVQSPSIASPRILQSTPQLSPTSALNAAAPGPIPASTPLVTRKDGSGVQWIQFEYSRDRVKVQYEIQCDVESVEVNKLPQEYKDSNCVYPRACHKEKYLGNRLQYETECNEVGWALAWLNPSLKGKRGLIQRAVDSWRNSNNDPKYQSRRVRRLAKSYKRNKASQQIQSNNTQIGLGVATSPISPTPTHPPPPAGTTTSHHHHLPSESIARGDFIEHTGRQENTSISPENLRYGQQALPASYPFNSTPHSIAAPMRDSSSNSGIVHPAFPTSLASGGSHSGPSHSRLLHELPYGPKSKKNMTIKDRQKDVQTRISVRLDNMEPDEIPDNYRFKNSVYPRSHYPRQIHPEPLDDATEGDDDVVQDRSHVPIDLEDGSIDDFDVSVPKLRYCKRERERALNDFGCHIMWGSNIQHFTDRNLFLQQALNVFRRDVEDKSSKFGHNTSALWQIRPGKRRWADQAQHGTDSDDY